MITTSKAIKSAFAIIRKRVAALSLILIGALCTSNSAYSDEAPGAIKLSVRAIQASEPEASGGTPSSTTGETERAMRIDQALKDLEPKLAQLPFASFQLLSAKEEVIALKTKNSLQLPTSKRSAYG
jgi:hypothetical protein